MWILLITILIVTGGLAIIDAPARARRHAAERALVLHALARAGTYDTEAGVASGLRGRANPWASARIIRAQLMALEEDGALLPSCPTGVAQGRAARSVTGFWSTFRSTRRCASQRDPDR